MFMKRLDFLAFMLSVVQIAFAQSFVRVNQVGYAVGMPKVATVANLEATFFELKDAKSNEVVYKGNLGKSAFWIYSRETIQSADFSDFNQEGTYYMEVNDEKSFPFVIGNADSLYSDLTKATMRAFYYWRASTPIEKPYSVFRGVDYSRKSGHPDTLVYIHQSASSEQRRAMSTLSSPGGWYDAGDFGKYVVNAGITLHQLVSSYEFYPKYYKNLSLNIPRKEKSLSCDFLEELKWEYDWLFTMQDPNDGGVYHKLTSLQFCEYIMPEFDDNDRFMMAKSTAATLDFVAEMAMGARVFRKENPEYALKALKAAEKAWNWAMNNPSVYFNNPPDVFTGGYEDGSVDDELFWAATEMFITTGEKKYFEKMDFFQKFDTPSWHNVNTLGLITLMAHKDELPNYVDVDKIDAKFKGVAVSLYNSFKFSPGRVALKKFVWGGNGDVASNGAILGLAYRLYKDDKFKEAMFANLDYLLGANPTEYSFISGFGKKYPMRLHDRRCMADGIDEPIPGYLAGGPNDSEMADCGKQNYPSSAPARCYLDESCSYSTNEVAINWNAPLVLLISMIENIDK